MLKLWHLFVSTSKRNLLFFLSEKKIKQKQKLFFKTKLLNSRKIWIDNNPAGSKK
jgi:hypothetical protein